MIESAYATAIRTGRAQDVVRIAAGGALFACDVRRAETPIERAFRIARLTVNAWMAR